MLPSPDLESTLAAASSRSGPSPSAWAFLGYVVGLGLLALISILVSPPKIFGLPDDADVRAAARLVRDRFRIEGDQVRFRSPLLGEGILGARFTAAGDSIVEAAEAHLVRARERQRHDPRLAAAEATLHLLRRRYHLAEAEYRRALGGVRYGEARLGLGVTLALRAEVESDPLIQRRLLLAAIAQFAAVEDSDAEIEPALYNRARLLALVGRHGEARQVAGVYLERDPRSEWSKRLVQDLRMSR